MANPAELLLAQFREWDARQNSAAQAREHDINAKFVGHLVAARHLDAISELLVELEATGQNVAVYQNQLVTWRQTLFVFRGGWEGVGSARIDSNALQHLETLAGLLKLYVPAATPEGVEGLRSYLAGVEEVLSDDALPEILRNHVRRLIDHVRLCIDEYDRYGDYELQEAIDRLLASMIRAAANSNDSNRWADLFNSYVPPFVVNVLSAIPAAALTQFALGH